MGHTKNNLLCKGDLVMRKTEKLETGIEVFLVTKVGVSVVSEENFTMTAVELLSSVSNQISYLEESELQRFYPILYNYN